MSIGKMPEFKPATDNWRLYVDRLEQYFVVNKVDKELHVPTLITVMGAECYELLVNLCTPDKPITKTFTEVAAILERHLQPKHSELAERYKFRQRKQSSSESVAEYVAVLKKMSITCEFGTWLEESLRDQLVCGMHSETIRQRLFTEEGLDFGKAYKLAVSMEAAERDAAVVEGREKASSGAVADCQAMTGFASRQARGPRASDFRSSGPAAAGLRSSRVVSTSGGRGGHAGTRGTGGAAAPALGRGANQCTVCGAGHEASTCRFARYVCKVCNRQGHLRRMCPYLVDQHCVEVEQHCVESMTASCGTEHCGLGFVGQGTDSDIDSDVSLEVIADLNQISIADCKPIYIPINVQGKLLEMECDTGSALSCISYRQYQQLFSNLNLQKCNLKLSYYSRILVSPAGIIKPLVKYKDKKKYLDLYVVHDGKGLLLGRQWLAELGIRIPEISYCDVNNVTGSHFNLHDFSSRYREVFADGLGRFTGGRVSIHLRPGARPVFLRARPLAYALREPVERALEQLVRDGVLTPVDRSDWATPIVPVVKKDGSIRICADYKLTLNRVLEVDRYPLPRVEDLLVRLHGGQRFSKIDLSQAYAQFELDESRKYTVINTHKGLFRYNRLVYGLSSSPGIFQRRLEQLFSDMSHVGVFLDDVIITGKDTKSHIDNLNKVFERLQSYGLRVRKDKCEFFADSINYLGHVISRAGVHTCPDKIKAIIKTPAPQNVSELRAFIGLIMYYGKFVRNISTILTPLYNLLKAGVNFVWSNECQAAFDSVKKAMSSSEVLVHYSSDMPVVLTADASSVGVGSVLSHLTPGGERPVAYASRTLTPTERAYAQIDREALAIIYGIRKFHQYLYGRKFILRTDHKPLTYIFGDKVGIPVMAASRLQRWAVLLSGYDYTIEYVPSAKNCADALSRLPQAKAGEEDTGEKTYLNFVEDFLPITNSDVKSATLKDRVLCRTLSYVQSGWPVSCPDDEMKPYFARRNELYVDRGCVMWGYRVAIPSSLQATILKQLHVSHMGIIKTKSLARSYVWWPNIDADVEALCRACPTCAAEAPAPPHAPPASWPYVARPWTRLHADFLSLKGKTFFVVIDSSTKWLEICEMSRTNASAVIKELRAIFARFGVPEQFVSDQGPPFTSSDLKDFLVKCGIRQSFSPVYHPASNGAAEGAVKLCKRAIKKAYRENVDIDAALQTYLLAYRNSVHSTTGESPAMLLQRRPLRTRLDLLRGEAALQERVQVAQARQTAAAGGKPRSFAPGDEVWARGYGAGDKWVKGTVIGPESSRTYSLSRDNGGSIVRHIDQVRRRSRMSTVPCPKETVEADEGESDVEGLGGPTEVEKDSTVMVEREIVPMLTSTSDVRSDSDLIPPPPREPLTRPPMNLRPLPHRKLKLEID
ncbi:uncharacterized protein K02A2.6-like [Cydia pomonella]|uniref:uncharacterized protein K02A2.6-like n=1 Tax=Cydia pomonella TaxID=82600 RepID=UPI002ADDD786|nr:uncharacterized protein K02A2.6-like [Cydia pomonella]